MISLSLLGICGCVFGYGSLSACARIPLDPKNKIPITLAANDLNRLSLKDGRISAVYGADIFNVELDGKRGQVFLHLKPNIELPGQVSLAITTEEGFTQDLEVFFTEDPAKPIVFELPPQPTSLRKEARQFFYDVLAGKTEDCVIQEGAQRAQVQRTQGRKTKTIQGEDMSNLNKTIDLGWGTMTLKHRILSPHSPFVVDYYDVVGNKPYCTYNIRHNLFAKPGTISKGELGDDSVCGVWLSERIVRGKKPVTVALLRMRNRV